MSKYKHIEGNVYERNGIFYKKIITKHSYSSEYDKYLHPAVDSRVLYDKIANIVRIKLAGYPVANYFEQTLMAHFIDTDTVFNNPKAFDELVTILPLLPVVSDEFEATSLVETSEHK